MKMMIKMIRYLCTDDDDDHNDSLKLEKLGVLLSTRVTTGRHSSAFCVCCWYRVVGCIAVLLSKNSMKELSYNKLWHFALALKILYYRNTIVTLVIVILGHGLLSEAQECNCSCTTLTSCESCYLHFLSLAQICLF